MVTVDFRQGQRAQRRSFHDVREFGGRNIDHGVDLAGVEAQPLQLLVDADRFDDRVEMGQRFGEVVGILHQHDALAADPVAQHEGAAADDVARKVVAPFLGDVARDGRRKRHRELVPENRVGRAQMKNDRRIVRRLDAARRARCDARRSRPRPRYHGSTPCPWNAWRDSARARFRSGSRRWSRYGRRKSGRRRADEM